MREAHQLWVKICATTSVDDALLASGSGADAVGFVFAPSPRQVTPAQVAAIARHLPAGLERIGVFTATAPDEAPAIAAAASEARLTAVQLHSPFDAGLITELRKVLPRSIGLILTTHWRVSDDLAAAERVRADLAGIAAAPSLDGEAEPRRVLVDAKVGHVSGGLGVSFDWELARPVLLRHPDLRIIVAGGLRPDNVAEAVRVLRPYGVDVASGVEQSPGRKDQAKVASFIENARRAFAG